MRRVGERHTSERVDRPFWWRPLGYVAASGALLGIAMTTTGCAVAHHVAQNQVQEVQNRSEPLTVTIDCWNYKKLKGVIIDGLRARNSVWDVEVDVWYKDKGASRMEPFWVSGRYKVPPSSEAMYNVGLLKTNATDASQHKALGTDSYVGNFHVTNARVDVYTASMDNEVKVYCVQGGQPPAYLKPYVIDYVPAPVEK